MIGYIGPFLLVRKGKNDVSQKELSAEDDRMYIIRSTQSLESMPTENGISRAASEVSGV